MIKKKDRWAGHVGRTGIGEIHTELWCGNLREDHFEDSSIYGSIKPVFEAWDGGHGLDGSGSGLEQVAGSCEYGHEPLGSVKCGAFLD
jgi:hypothetical protein